MVFNTLTVASNVTPTVIGTWFSHYLNRKELHQKPTAHISYHVALRLIRQFIVYSSYHTVEDIQGFTSQYVPNPRWVRLEDIEVPQGYLTKAATHLQTQLGPRGIQQVGGKEWWQWRKDDAPFKAEWIEMRSHYTARKKAGAKCTRVMLYVHGGAYYFGSVDEHRYQMQRHARKLQARVFAPRYRLAPQFPFPCGLQDCLAAYLYLLTVQDPDTIILAGDSAGGGMVVSMLVTLRDQGIPLPVGAILISPWVDLTHSFPSVAGNSPMDYIPPHGFVHQPSPSWPPPNSDDQMQLKRSKSNMSALDKKDTSEKREAAQGFTVEQPKPNEPPNPFPDDNENLSIDIDGKRVEIKDQIQMYATNNLLSHPLVSPVLQPSLGGLPPLMILTGGGEMLRDEQIYLAHKAAAPTEFPPSEAYFDANPAARDEVNKWPPTKVQLQVWDDLCHVAPTLSFTRPAKYMYRSIAQFGAWLLATAQRTEVNILVDDDVSIISHSSTDSSAESSNDSDDPKDHKKDIKDGDREHNVLSESPDGATAVPQTSTAEISPKILKPTPSTIIGQAGDPIPPFTDSMIRQRVTRHGETYALEERSELPACTQPTNSIGVIKPGPVRKWMHAQQEWSRRFAKQKRAMQAQRLQETKDGVYVELPESETPPATALVGRRKKSDESAAGRRRRAKESAKKAHKSRGLMLWSLFGSKHDEDTLENEKEMQDTDQAIEEDVVTAQMGRQVEGGRADGARSRSRAASKAKSKSRARAKSNTAKNAPETAAIASVLSPANDTKENYEPKLATSTGNDREAEAPPSSAVDGATTPAIVTTPGEDSSTATTVPLQPAPTSHRPPVGDGVDGLLFPPFKLASPLGGEDAVNASTATLISQKEGVIDEKTEASVRAEMAKEGVMAGKADV